MDPLTRAAREFVRQLSEVWRRPAPVRLIAPECHRTHLLRSLRLFEWAPDNRWPLCLIELPADGIEALGEAAVARVLADLAELRRGLAEDGISLAEWPEVVGDAWQRLERIVERAGEALARTGVVEGLALALVPAGESDRRMIRGIAERLRTWPERPHVRVALWCGEDDGASESLPGAVVFALDEEALDDYVREQSERQIASEPPDEAAIHRSLLVASEAARRNDLAAAKQAYEAAGGALEGRGKLAEAAVIQMALGGLSFGLGDLAAALAHFDRAVGHGRSSGQAMIVSQACFGAAGALFASGEYSEAAARYRAAAGGAPESLRIEALRMAGAAHMKLGERDAAALAWQEAVDCAAGMPARSREQTSWRLAGEAMLEVLQKRGLAEQVEHLRAVLHDDGEVSGVGGR